MNTVLNEYIESARQKALDGLYHDALFYYGAVLKRLDKTFSNNQPDSAELAELKECYETIKSESEKCRQILNAIENVKRTVQLAVTGGSHNRKPNSLAPSIDHINHIEAPSEPISVNVEDTNIISKQREPKLSIYSSKPSFPRRTELKKPPVSTLAQQRNQKQKASSVRGGPDPQYPNELHDIIERQILVRNPSVRWSDVAGCEHAKQILRETVILPSVIPQYFTGIRRPWKGILMVGPPGTGKTLLAKAVASECDSTFLSVSSATLISKYLGESEKLVKALFTVARQRSPCIIFLDEIDALCSRRGAANEHEASRRIKSELLIQMDGLISSSDSSPPCSVIVIGATNFPWDLDEALRRRLEKRVYIPLPDLGAREQLLLLNLKHITLSGDVDTRDLAKRLQGYSGSDITNVCRDASMMAMRHKFSGLTMDEIAKIPENELLMPTSHDDFLRAISNISPSVSRNDVCKYEAWIKEFGSL